MDASFDPDDSDAEIFRAFGLACQVERDRISLAGIADEDRRFDTSADDRAIAEKFAARLIATIARR